MLHTLLLGILPFSDEARLAGAARRRLVELVIAHPGLPVGEIARRLQIGQGTLHYHLRRAEARGEIRTQQQGRRRLVFPAHAATEDARVRALALLGGRTVLAIAEHILAHPGSSLVDVMAAVGESPRTVYYHVKRLREAELVLSASRTRYRDLRPSPLLHDILSRRE